MDDSQDEILKLLKAMGNKSENSQITFNSKNVITTLIGVLIIGIITSAFSVWSNDKDQDNAIDNIANAVNQTQKNQVILGKKMDAFTESPRYTKVQHDSELQVTKNEITQNSKSIEKLNTEVRSLVDKQRDVLGKIEIIEVIINKK
ncbi:hypothetical protein [Maribacter sp.]|uniref:hypothetical protein n=1 Tax=Maribacter sp. TaxID=1897614 RepID=UPI0025BA4DE3|nr:hypothetical protein [Maribacter sp.]